MAFFVDYKKLFEINQLIVGVNFWKLTDLKKK